MIVKNQILRFVKNLLKSTSISQKSYSLSVPGETFEKTVNSLNPLKWIISTEPVFLFYSNQYIFIIVQYFKTF